MKTIKIKNEFGFDLVFELFEDEDEDNIYVKGKEVYFPEADEVWLFGKKGYFHVPYPIGADWEIGDIPLTSHDFPSEVDGTLQNVPAYIYEVQKGDWTIEDVVEWSKGKLIQSEELI